MSFLILSGSICGMTMERGPEVCAEVLCLGSGHFKLFTKFYVAQKNRKKFTSGLVTSGTDFRLFL